MRDTRPVKAAAVLLLAVTAGAAAAEHPKVFLAPEDAARARKLAARDGWARQTADAILLEARAWMARDDAWLRRAVPAAGAAFAYGFTGCPICGGSWGTWGSVRASFDNPGHVTCANNHVLPDAAHPDPGTGYAAPDGRIHYFAGSYNAWVVETLTFRAADHLAQAYSLTGDESYAAKAALILDALANVYPACAKGSWDYPSNPPSGRFNRPWYQVARVLIHYVNQYDQIYHAKALDGPSVRAGFTIRRNIEENLLRNGAEYCYRQSQAGGLNNGEADYIRGALAVGVCLGIPSYVQWATDGPYGIRALVANNVDRDGGYFETSSMYADHTRGLYFTFAEPLLSQGLNLYRDPKLQRLFVLHNLAQSCAGHKPDYGDTGPDTGRTLPPARPFDASDYDFLERMYARAADPESERGLGALLRWMAGGDLETFRASAPMGGPLDGALEGRRWLLFHARPAPAGEGAPPADILRRVAGSHFMGQKGLGILRTPDGAQAVLLRFGPSLNHGHLDDLNFSYYARGYEMLYDLGYGLGSTHTQVGWARQTASHNVVMVDEQPQMEDGQTGGSLHLFAELPLARVMEASSESCYRTRGVSLYRRTLALIGGGADAYLVDLFRVRGGRQHDWLLHAPGDRLDVLGVDLGAGERGSLAGPDISWGDQQLNDGDMRGHPNQPYWNPPPGNGYGFLVKPRRGTPAGAWSADWPIDPATHLRLWVPATPATEVIAARAPGIYPRLPGARYVVARRRGENLSSQFAAALEPYGESPAIAGIERLPAEGDPGDAMALRVRRRDGADDYIFSSGDTAPHRWVGVTFAGRFAHARVKGTQLMALEMVGATLFDGFGYRSSPPSDAWRGAVSATDAGQGVVVAAEPIRDPTGLAGQVIVFSNPLYSRTTAYRVAGVEGNRIRLDGTALLGIGKVDAVRDAHTIASSIPHEYARGVKGSYSGFFQGKRIANPSGAATRITGIRYGQPMAIAVEDAGGWKAGDGFSYEDVQPGDRFEVLRLVTRK